MAEPTSLVFKWKQGCKQWDQGMALEVWGVIPCSAPSIFKTLKSMSKNQRSRKEHRTYEKKYLEIKILTN